MLYFSLILIILRLDLTYTFELNGPFYLTSSERYYQVKHSQNSDLEIITLNQTLSSKFALRVSSEEIKTFNVTTNYNKYKVLIFHQQLNPFITDLPMEILLKLLCKFHYPISLVGEYGLYKCSFFYLSTQSRRIQLGSCQLNLRVTTCLCAIQATFKKEFLSNLHSIQVSVEVSKCYNCQQDSTDGKWQSLASSNLTIYLKTIDNLIWYESFYNKTSKIGLLLGIPRSTINREIGFELPVKVILPQVYRSPLTLIFRFQWDEDIRFTMEFPQHIAELLELHEEIHLDAFTMGLKFHDNVTHDMIVSSPIIVLKVTGKNGNLNPFNVSAAVQDAFSVSKLKDLENISNMRKFYVSVAEEEKLLMIPEFNRPLIVQNIENHMEARAVKKELFTIFYIFDDSIIDVTDKLHCQSFDKSKLKCPSNMESYTDEQSRYINNYKSLEWSIELKLGSWKTVLDIKPQIINENLWEISISDYVLNKINGWRGPENRIRSALLKDETCKLLYQITPIKIFRRVKMYSDINQDPVEKMLDVTNQIDIASLSITPKIVSIHKYGNYLFLQGIKEGDFKLDVKDYNNNVMVSKSLKVLGDKVYVKDIEVSCYPSINLTSKSLVFSFLVNIHYINMSFNRFNKSKDCVISIDLIFTDNSRCNIFTIPNNQFFVKFITNREVLEVFELNDMFYNYFKFNNNTSFYVEIMESKMCSDPQTVFKKLIHLEPPSTLEPIPSTKSISISTTTTVPSINTKIVSTESQSHSSNSSFIQKWVIVLVGLFSIFVLIVLCKLMRDCISKKKLQYHLSRRRQLCTNDNENKNGALPFSSDYPPLLPCPGPLVGSTDNASVTLSSPQSFWCLNHNNKSGFSKKSLLQPFSRQYTHPVKEHSRKDTHKYAQPCPPLRWIHKILPEEVDMNIYSSQDPIDISPMSIPGNGSQMCWSVTQMEGDQSSGIGSLMTHMDDFLKDPYEARDKFSKLSEIPRILTDNKETVYEPI